MQHIHNFTIRHMPFPNLLCIHHNLILIPSKTYFTNFASNIHSGTSWQ